MTLEEQERSSMLQLSVEELYEQLEWVAKEHWPEISAPDRVGISGALQRAQIALGNEGVA